MRNKKSILYSIILMLMMSFSIAPNVKAKSTIPIAKTREAASVLNYGIEWRFKNIDGILYKRLYNYSTNQWIGNWQKA